MLLGLSNEVYFLDDFWKISLGRRFAFFRKMRVLSDLAKVAITWLFRNFWSRCLLLNLVQSLQIKCILLEDNAICARVLLGLSNEGYFLGDFWKISLGPPFALFLENAGFGWPCQNFHNLAIRAVFGCFLRQNLLQSLHYKWMQFRG